LRRENQKTGSDPIAVTTNGEPREVVVAQSPADETEGQFSPDGRSVASHLATGTNVVGNKPQYAVARDGRFLLNTAIESASSPIVVWVNWMKRLSP